MDSDQHLTLSLLLVFAGMEGGGGAAVAALHLAAAGHGGGCCSATQQANSSLAGAAESTCAAPAAAVAATAPGEGAWRGRGACGEATFTYFLAADGTGERLRSSSVRCSLVCSLTDDHGVTSR